jgi:OmpA-OmpF porin, OOP family
LSPSTEIEIAGHTDSWGDDAANQHLSERRALAVRTYLVSRGAAGNLVAKGFGGSRPIADNLTADGRYANRRIEFVVKG